VERVSLVDVAAGATFTIGNPWIEALVDPFSNSGLIVHIPKGADQEVAQSERIPKSLEAICHMMLPPGHSTYLRRVEFRTEAIEPEDIGVWIDQVGKIRVRPDRIS
jgi:hypothetical protein